MSLLLDALQRASQEKSGGQARLTTAQESLSRPAPDVPLQIADDQRPPPSSEPSPKTPLQRDTLTLDDSPHWPERTEFQTEETVETPLATASLASLSLELLQEPFPSQSPSNEPALIEPPRIQAPPSTTLSSPSIQIDPSALTATPTPVPPSATATHTPSLERLAEADSDASGTHHIDSPPSPASSPASSPSATPDLAHHLLNASKAAPQPSRKRVAILGGIAVLLLCSGIAAYFLVDLESLFMPSNTLSVAAPNTASPQPSPPASIAQSTSPETTSPAEAPVEAPTEKTSSTTTPNIPSPTATHTLPPSSPGKATLSHSKKHTQLTDKTPPPPPAPSPSSTPVPKPAPPPSAPSIARRTADTDDVHQAYGALTQGHLDEARSAYQRVLQTQPEDRDALLGLAYIAQVQGRSDEARDLYRRVLRQEPDNTTANAGLLALLANSGLSNTHASGLARDLSERHPRSAAAYATLGDLMVREGRLADAQQAYFKAVALEAGNARYAYNLAVALDRLHKSGQALSYYERAITLSTKTATPDPIPQDIIRQRIEQLRTALTSPATTETTGAP